MTEAQSEQQRIVVTGASGFLARVVANGARKAGWDVQTAGRQADADFCCAGVDAPEQIADWLSTVRPHVIFHGAGSADVRSSFNSPSSDLSASVGTWSRWLEAARLWGGKPLMIFPSSAAVYGAPETLPVREDAPCQPISPYGMHKRFGEQLAAQYHTHFGVPTVVLRLFSVFGPHQRRLLVWELFRRLQDSVPALEIMGSGQETRDYLFEEDVASAVLHLGSKATDIAAGAPQLYNLASGREISVLNLATLLKDTLADPRPIVCKGEARLGDPTRWCADPSSFRAAFPGWSSTPLEDGLRFTLQAWKDEGGPA